MTTDRDAVDEHAILDRRTSTDLHGLSSLPFAGILVFPFDISLFPLQGIGPLTFSSLSAVQPQDPDANVATGSPSQKVYGAHDHSISAVPNRGDCQIWSCQSAGNLGRKGNAKDN